MVTFIPLRISLAKPGDPFPQKLDEILPIGTLRDPETELTHREMLRWEHDTQQAQDKYVSSGELDATEQEMADSEPDFTE